MKNVLGSSTEWALIYEEEEQKEKGQKKIEEWISDSEVNNISSDYY